MRRTLHLRHLRRLQSGIPLSVESSAIHLDLLIVLRNVLSYVSTIAHVVQEDLSVTHESNEEQLSSDTEESNEEQLPSDMEEITAASHED